MKPFNEFKSIVIKAPNTKPNDERFSIFLAGSIEMGAAENWQDKAFRLLKKEGVVLLNPRRDDWDSSWKQEITDPQFNEQVTWELDCQDAANAIIMYFDPKTKSPITLLELGLYANSKKIFVCCPEGFWRKGNVDIVCERFSIPTFSILEDLIKAVIQFKNK